MTMEKNTGPKTTVDAACHVAVGAQSNDHSAHLAGVSTHRFFTDADTFVRVQLLVTEYYKLDVLSNFWDVYNIEAEALGQTVVYHPGGIPDTDRTRPLIGTLSDLDRLSPPNPHRSGRMPWVLQINRNYLEMAGTLERVYFTAPFSLAVNIRGYENLVADMFERPRFAHRLFTFLCDDVLSPYLETMRETVDIPDLLMDGRDAWASPPMLSLDMMDEYVVAYTERLRRNLGGNLITRGNWGDAKSRDPERFFSQKCRCSPGSLSVLDPDLFEVGPERVKRYARQHDLSVALAFQNLCAKKWERQAYDGLAVFLFFQLARFQQRQDFQRMIHQRPATVLAEFFRSPEAPGNTHGIHARGGGRLHIHGTVPHKKE